MTVLVRRVSAPTMEGPLAGCRYLTVEREGTCYAEHLLADESQEVQENNAAKLAEAEAAAKAAAVQASFSEARKVYVDDSQADLDEAIAKMVAEGGPNY